MNNAPLEEDFENLSRDGYRKTSPATDRPNCIGWALYDYNQYWDPNMIGVRGYYWPPGVPKEDSLESWTKVFEIHGYRICEGGELDAESEKIAIYADAKGIPQHVARQKSSGVWVSKCGKGEDIEHNTLDALTGELYGKVVRFMKRPRLPGAE
jgi:hypothetical protein